MNIFDKLSRKLMHLRLQPIHVYCLHHVCETFDSESMCDGDWMDINVFKDNLLFLRHKGVHFISMIDAYKKISNDFFRFKKYAVISFDDGYASFKEIIPWLKEQSIPVTLFVNTDYADGKAYRTTDKESYLTREELSILDVEVGMHGIQHMDATKMTTQEFKDFVNKTITDTLSIRGYIPFWAYTWGRHNSISDKVLEGNCIIPVLIDGLKNYNDTTCIHRELIN